MEEKKLLKRRKKAQRDNNEAALISASTDLANLYQEQGRFDFAIDEFTILAEIYKKNNTKLEYGVVNRGIAEAYVGLHKFDTALHHLKIYYQITKELGNKLEEQRALATLGHTYLSSYLESADKPNKIHLYSANKFFNKSLKICESLGGTVGKVEVADMSARLFCNLGVVQDCLGQSDRSIELISKSIALCKSNDLYEQLQRSHVALAAVLEKAQDIKAALQQYNFAVETAKKLRDKPSLLACALLSKSELFTKLGDFHGAKISLLRAYKMKIPDEKERKTIEHNLRVVAVMCKTEDEILTTRDTDVATLKKLYEKMGDGACELKNYPKAIDYYKKMLDCAVKAALSDANLASCHYSLAETYKDNGQYPEAIGHFETELRLCTKLKDKLNTLSKIADTKECADSPVADVHQVYKEAVQLCRAEGNGHEEGRMLNRLILYLRRQQCHTNAFTVQQELDKLNYDPSDSDGDSSTSPEDIIGNKINLEEITDQDLTDDSDTERASTKPRRRTRKNIAKKNQKGETPLHVACIKGNLNVVRHLLEQGHPVNIRDNCGWLPLHEACNHGHLDIVKLLLDRGAAINDRGGVGCEGYTPLHDAANNGHLHVVQLLLSRGANPLVKTDSGYTVLTCLNRWRNDQVDAAISQDVETLYRSIIGQVNQALGKAGVVEKSSTGIIDIDEDDSDSQNGLQVLTKSLSKNRSFEDMRRSTTVGLEDHNPPTRVTQAYRSVMDTLRHRNDKKSPPAPSGGVTKRPALVEGEMLDEWLEDDLGKSVKKRRKTDSPKSAVMDLHNDDDEDEDEENYFNPMSPSTSFTGKSHSPSGVRKRKHQAKLTSFGHTRTIVEADSTGSPKVRSCTSSPKPISKFDSFDNCRPLVQPDPTLCVDVRIAGKLYRVPVLSSQVNTHTIRWLANEAAARYAKKEYMVPVLELETHNGAVLADDDSVSLLFPMGGPQAEEVTARITKWTVPSLIDRYTEACQDMGVELNGTVSQILKEFSTMLDLSNSGLKGCILAPLCKTLNRQTNLLELNLGGNFITDECVELLSVSLITLPNLYKLNLNCTSLVSEQLQIMSSKLPDGATYHVTDFDLSDNWLDDQCLQSLAVITRHFELKRVNLSGNRFTKDLFNVHWNRDVTLNLDQVEEFDLSDNDLSNEAVVKILSWLRPVQLKYLNVSRNSVSHGFLRELLGAWGELDEVQLVTLGLSRCCVHDSDLFDLLRMSTSLRTLDLSYNDELTSISLRRLLQADHLIKLDLYGCGNVCKYFTELCKYVEQPSDVQDGGKTIKLCVDLEKNLRESEYLVDMWKKLYGSRAVIEQSSRLLSLSVSG